MTSRLFVTFFLGIVFCGHGPCIVESKSLVENSPPEKRDTLQSPKRDDNIVREMVELLQIQRQFGKKHHKFDSHWEDLIQQDTITSPPLVQQSILPDVRIGESATHYQLCTDAYSYLSDKPAIMEKRDLVINYVVNYCIESSTTSDILALLEFVQGYNQLDDADDWLNWPEFEDDDFLLNWPQLDDVMYPSSPPTTAPRAPTTVETRAPTTIEATTVNKLKLWNGLLQKLLDNTDDDLTSSAAEPVSTTTPNPVASTSTEDWFYDLLNDLLGDEEDGDEQNNGQDDDEDNSNDEEDEFEDGDIEDIFYEFWNMIEGSTTTTAVVATTTSTVTPTTETSLELNEDQLLSNSLPSSVEQEAKKRTEMKKRLLHILANSLLQKRFQAMRK